MRQRQQRPHEMLTKCPMQLISNHAYNHDWENIEINKFNILLTKEILKLLHMRSCSYNSRSCTPKKLVVRNKLCDCCTP